MNNDDDTTDSMKRADEIYKNLLAVLIKDLDSHDSFDARAVIHALSVTVANIIVGLEEGNGYAIKGTWPVLKRAVDNIIYAEN